METTHKGNRPLRLAMSVLGVTAFSTAAGIGVSFAAGVHSPPASITTCTVIKSGKTKVTGTGCNSKSTVKTWVDSRYRQFQLDLQTGVPSTSYANMDFSNTNIPMPDDDGFVFTNSNFSSADITGVTNLGGELSGSNLTSANFHNATFEGIEFDEDNLTGANFSGSFWEEQTVMDTDTFTNAIFTGLDLSANFENSTFTDANMTGVDFVNADLTGATFTGATMTSVQFHNTICPNGSNSDTHPFVGCFGQGGGL